MKTKIVYNIQTILFIIYFAITPLIFSFNTRRFQDIKLSIIYLCITLAFLLTVIFYKSFNNKYKLAYRTFRIEWQLMLVAALVMSISFVINYSKMRLILDDDIIDSNVFKGAGPNFLSIFFYWFSAIIISTSVVSFKYINKSLISKLIVLSLIIVGSLIFYQIFVTDFLGRGQNYLFGFGNSNYLPDPFSIIGLILLIPLIFNEKTNYLHIGIGIFFFEIVLLSSSRGAYFALLFSIIITSIILLKKKKTKLKRIIILFGLAFSIFLISYQIFVRLGFQESISDYSNMSSLIDNKSLDSYSLLSRFDIWKYSIELFASDPYSIILGSGQSVFKWNSSTTHYIVTNSHNQYIGTLLSGGIIVFVIFIILFVKQFIYALRLTIYDINNIVLLSALIFISVKWLFNSLNASHSPFVLMVFSLISFRYMEMKNKTEDLILK